ncbi:hypothetical protein QJ854_gp123 [Moumouvirus goulette]|uniref:Uncharacterized protein n=1 Tax=Moumouvirus goulette TaxID=1247379 RepID=M1PCF6_9VIRU|nr:hypothetical protein QJ854_gp123 [Moumouvirus goulette]AGF85659.1 hypothetical protein glt_00854 [Moumouvirus goulette]
MPYYLFYYGDHKKIRHIICRAKNRKKLYDYLINNVEKFIKFFQMIAFSWDETYIELYDVLVKLAENEISDLNTDEIIGLLRNGLKKMDYNYFFDKITGVGGSSYAIEDAILTGFKKIRSKNFLKIDEYK